MPVWGEKVPGRSSRVEFFTLFTLFHVSAQTLNSWFLKVLKGLSTQNGCVVVVVQDSHARLPNVQQLSGKNFHALQVFRKENEDAD